MKKSEWFVVGLLVMLFGSWVYGAFTAPPDLSVGQDFLYENAQAQDREIEDLQETVEELKKVIEVTK